MPTEASIAKALSTSHFLARRNRSINASGVSPLDPSQKALLCLHKRTQAVESEPSSAPQFFLRVSAEQLCRFLLLPFLMLRILRRIIFRLVAKGFLALLALVGVLIASAVRVRILIRFDGSRYTCTAFAFPNDGEEALPYLCVTVSASRPRWKAGT